MIGMRRARGDAGFTLLEILLALAILAFITTTLWGAFSQTNQIKRRIEAAQDRMHTVRIALMRMTREIEMAFLSDSEMIGSQERRTMFIGSSRADIDELRFSWFGRQRLRADAVDADTSVVLYYGQPDPERPGVLNLMRRETRRLVAQDPLTVPGEAYLLCDHVVSLNFSYYDYKNREWKEEWDTMGATGLQYLPTHVRISLTVSDERGREVTFVSAARIQMTERVAYRPVRS